LDDQDNERCVAILPRTKAGPVTSAAIQQHNNTVRADGDNIVVINLLEFIVFRFPQPSLLSGFSSSDHR